MQKNSKKEATSPADVMPAVARFISRHDKEDFTQAPAHVQEMFNSLMETDAGDNKAYRQRMLGTLAMIQDFGSIMEPFTQEDIWKAVNHE